MHMCKDNDDKPIIGHPIGWEQMTKVEGNPMRHIEQLWDEIHKLKEKLKNIEDRFCLEDLPLPPEGQRLRRYCVGGVGDLLKEVI